MIVKTKKYQLPTNLYIQIGFTAILKEQWWVWFIPAAILLIPVLYTPALWWCVGLAVLASLLYLLFWYIQFYGITQMEQSKTLFEKLFYEIDSRQILIKISENQGMPMTWDKIVKVEKRKDAYLLVISKAQFIYLPFDIFRSENDLKFFESVLKRKELLKAA